MNKILVCLLFVLTVLTSIACVSAVNVDNATSQTAFNVDDVDSNLILDENIDNVNLFTNSSECSVIDNCDNIIIDFENQTVDFNTIKNTYLTSTNGSITIKNVNIQNDNNNNNNNPNLIIDYENQTVDFNTIKNTYLTSTNGSITIKNVNIQNDNLTTDIPKVKFDMAPILPYPIFISPNPDTAKHSIDDINITGMIEPKIGSNILTIVPFIPKNNTTNPILPIPIVPFIPVPFIPKNNTTNPILPILPILPFIPKNNTTNPILPIFWKL